MKNLILAIVMAAAASASAELYYATVNTGASPKDTSHDKTTSYSGYLCTVESAKDLFNNQTTVEGQTAWFASHYSAVLAGLASGAAKEGSGITALAPDPVGYMQGQYSVTEFYKSGLAGDYLAVVLYASGADSAFRIFGKDSSEVVAGGLIFDDDGNTQAVAGKFSKWTGETVPEPTSGLLMLLGLAGLALKRKRA